MIQHRRSMRYLSFFMVFFVGIAVGVALEHVAFTQHDSDVAESPPPPVPPFMRWLEELREDARKHGISEQTLVGRFGGHSSTSCEYS